jgi:hypothetical protein
MWSFLIAVGILGYMEEIIIAPIEWSAPEYSHKERNPDWFWAIGLSTIVACILALWFRNYLFAIFLLISGACLILFTLRHPEEVSFSIKTEGITIGKDIYAWKTIKGFSIKRNPSQDKLLILTSKKFLPTYTIPIPGNLTEEIYNSLLKVTPNIELEESRSMLFMEKLGF